MRSILFATVLAASLGACANAPDGSTSAAASPGASSFRDAQPLTGSRLVRRSSDRNVGVIEGEEARKEMLEVRSLGNAVGQRGN